MVPRILILIIYLGAIKNHFRYSHAGSKRTKIAERPLGPTFKTSPGSVMVTLSCETTKSAESFDNHTFEGEGDASRGETIKEMRAPRSLGILHKATKVQSHCTRVMFSGIRSISIVGSAH
jgi:hypothetical protein